MNDVELRERILTIAEKTWNGQTDFLLHLGRLSEYVYEGTYLSDLKEIKFKVDGSENGNKNNSR